MDQIFWDLSAFFVFPNNNIDNLLSVPETWMGNGRDSGFEDLNAPRPQGRKRRLNTALGWKVAASGRPGPGAIGAAEQ